MSLLLSYEDRNVNYSIYVEHKADADSLKIGVDLTVY